ncbi:MAG: hypothetical protein A2066_14980 [Bacteroidetes bacterium GWB2_41_8]|nr:MAG: hypothetical protein A2066_14980 [Bacteroidetes bacterium GWB2_41_8]
MNESRRKVEEYKRSASHDLTREISWNIKIDKTNLDYSGIQKAYQQAFDNEVAKRIGVSLDDHESWATEQAQINAKEWAASLPDA